MQPPDPSDAVYLREAPCSRFIPARAGNTPSSSSARPGRPVHPRAGGEHASFYSFRVGHNGSSPRGRGTRAARGPASRRVRFIPARAGNTREKVYFRPAFAVHPRAGGEHTSASARFIVSFGSSPRGRGTRSRAGHPPRRRRFIPARAGNTAPAGAVCRPASVHPRAGGEHSHCSGGDTPPSGSSPRGRGTLHALEGAGRRIRFIPARAGNTHRAAPDGDLAAVHPRAGGEHEAISPMDVMIVGSSPRGRGTQPFPLHPEFVQRFIPARAGNTPCIHEDVGDVGVHPRAGGEHLPAAQPP